MDDDARIPRLLALLAGNGFVVVKVNSLTEQGAITYKYFALSYLVLSLIGLAGAYIAIARKPDASWAVWGERIGTGVLAIFAIVWFVATAFYYSDSKHTKRIICSHESNLTDLAFFIPRLWGNVQLSGTSGRYKADN